MGFNTALTFQHAELLLAHNTRRGIAGMAGLNQNIGELFSQASIARCIWRLSDILLKISRN